MAYAFTLTQGPVYLWGGGQMSFSWTRKNHICAYTLNRIFRTIQQTRVAIFISY